MVTVTTQRPTITYNTTSVTESTDYLKPLFVVSGVKELEATDYNKVYRKVSIDECETLLGNCLATDTIKDFLYFEGVNLPDIFVVPPRQVASTPPTPNTKTFAVTGTSTEDGTLQVIATENGTETTFDVAVSNGDTSEAVKTAMSTSVSTDSNITVSIAGDNITFGSTVYDSFSITGTVAGITVAEKDGNSKKRAYRNKQTIRAESDKKEFDLAKQTIRAKSDKKEFDLAKSPSYTVSFTGESAEEDGYLRAYFGSNGLRSGGYNKDGQYFQIDIKKGDTLLSILSKMKDEFDSASSKNVFKELTVSGSTLTLVFSDIGQNLNEYVYPSVEFLNTKGSYILKGLSVSNISYNAEDGSNATLLDKEALLEVLIEEQYYLVTSVVVDDEQKVIEQVDSVFERKNKSSRCFYFKCLESDSDFASMLQISQTYKDFPVIPYVYSSREFKTSFRMLKGFPNLISKNKVVACIFGGLNCDTTVGCLLSQLSGSPVGVTDLINISNSVRNYLFTNYGTYVPELMWKDELGALDELGLSYPNVPASKSWDKLAFGELKVLKYPANSDISKIDNFNTDNLISRKVFEAMALYTAEVKVSTGRNARKTKVINTTDLKSVISSLVKSFYTTPTIIRGNSYNFVGTLTDFDAFSDSFQLVDLGSGRYSISYRLAPDRELESLEFNALIAYNR